MKRCSFLSRAGLRWLFSLLTLSVLAPVVARGQSDIIINEILAINNTIAPLAEFPDYFPDYVELYNPTDQSIDLGAAGYKLSKKRSPSIVDPEDFFSFPVGSIVPPDGYLLVFMDNDTNAPGIHASFNLGGTNQVTLNMDGDGDDVLLCKDVGGLAVPPFYTLVDVCNFGMQVPELAVGRVPEHTGEFTLIYPSPSGGTVPFVSNAPFTNFGNQMTLKINEWLAFSAEVKGQTIVTNRDWFEIYNPDTNIVVLSGMVFADRNTVSQVPLVVVNPPEDALKFVAPLSYIAPLGFVQIFCLGAGQGQADSADEVNFSLSSTGGTTETPADDIWMFATNDLATVIDHVELPRFNQPADNDVTRGRLPDGGDYIPSDARLPRKSPKESNISRSPPSITVQPVSRTVNVGQSVVFSVMATGSGQLNFQWFEDGANIPSATNASYSIPAVADSDAGNYSVAVSNSLGSVTSSNAILTVLNTPIFATHPLTQTVGVFGNVILSATAYGAPPLLFQWYFGGTPIGAPITGTNVALLSLTNVQINQSGNYHVQVINGYGSVTSSDAVLSVVVVPPSIEIQPSSQSPLLGESASFTVSVIGTPPFQYQWRFNGADIPDATNATYTIPAVTEFNAGNYSVMVANSAGSATSGSATLLVIVPPRLGLQMLAGYPVLSLHGMLGRNFNVEYVTSLTATNWVNLRSFSNLSAIPFQFLDADGGTQSARYYRAIMR